MNYSKEQILQISKGDHEIAHFITSLVNHIQELNAHIQHLNQRVHNRLKGTFGIVFIEMVRQFGLHLMLEKLHGRTLS